ncbi:MAG: DUF4345 family protein [Nannocystales bacterium]
METSLHIIVGLAGLPLLFLGLRSLFKPRTMADAFSVVPKGAAGLSTLRSLPGGLFLASVAMLILGLTTGDTTWLLSVALIMGAVAMGRIVGIVSDGLVKEVVPPLLVELVIGGALVTAHFVLGAP